MRGTLDLERGTRHLVRGSRLAAQCFSGVQYTRRSGGLVESGTRCIRPTCGWQHFLGHSCVEWSRWRDGRTTRRRESLHTQLNTQYDRKQQWLRWRVALHLRLVIFVYFLSRVSYF
jgi:hypothetical protein